MYKEHLRPVSTTHSLATVVDLPLARSLSLSLSISAYLFVFYSLYLIQLAYTSKNMKYSKAKPLLDVTTGRSPIYHLYSLSISSFTNRSDQSDLAPPDWFGHFQLKSPEQSPGCGVLPFLPTNTPFSTPLYIWSSNLCSSYAALTWHLRFRYSYCCHFPLSLFSLSHYLLNPLMQL